MADSDPLTRRAIFDIVRYLTNKHAERDADGRLSVVVNNDKGIAVLLYPSDGDTIESSVIQTEINTVEDENQFKAKYPVNQEFAGAVDLRLLSRPMVDSTRSRQMVNELIISALTKQLVTERQTREAISRDQDKEAEA